MMQEKTNLFFVLILFLSFTTIQPRSYSSTAFIESMQKISNPDQGFYYPITVIMTPNSFEQITYWEKTGQMLQLICDISQFSGAINSDKIDKKISTSALNALETFISNIKKDNKNIVIRFGYDPEFAGSYADNEPSLEMIKTHIEQLSVILNKFKDTITAIQAGMLGPWGEMHGSKLGEDDKNKAFVFEHWLKNTNKIPILARTPKAIFTYFDKTLDEMENYEIKSTDKGYYLGLYNDCYLSDENDWDTYVFDRERETKWLSTQNEHLPFGGETCAVHEMSDLENCIPEMKLLKLNYINMDYNKDVLEKWKNSKYSKTLGSDSLYYGMNGFDYIERHLGYRLLIKNIKVDYEKYGSYKMKIQLRNVGFGNLFKSKKVDIIYVDMNNKEIYRKTVGNYKGALNMEFQANLLDTSGSSEYKVYLSIYGSIEDDVVYYPVKFANKNIYDDNLKAHLLFYVKNGVINQP